MHCCIKKKVIFKNTVVHIDSCSCSLNFLVILAFMFNFFFWISLHFSSALNLLSLLTFSNLQYFATFLVFSFAESVCLSFSFFSYSFSHIYSLTPIYFCCVCIVHFNALCWSLLLLWSCDFLSSIVSANF